MTNASWTIQGIAMAGFVFSGALIVYVLLGYPLLLAWRARFAVCRW